MTTFAKFMKDHQEKMNLFTKAILRAHGQHHPEVEEVREIYQVLQIKSMREDSDLDSEFNRLRCITHGYRIPEDVCPTFEAVYKFLEEAEEMYKGWSEEEMNH